MIKEVEGIILLVTPFKESSKIINIYTKEYGLIGVICKGAMNIKSKIRSITDRLTYAKFNIYYKQNKLSTLVDGTIINPFKNIKNDITLISYATYLCDLVNQVIKQHDDENIYDDLINSLIKIDEGNNPMVITNILEVKLLDYLGVRLNLKSCIKCGNNKDIITLSEELGGLICKNCYNNEKIFPIKMIKLLNMYYLVDIKSINNINIDKDMINSINMFLNTYYEDYTGLYIKSKDFIKSLKEIN